MNKYFERGITVRPAGYSAVYASPDLTPYRRSGIRCGVYCLPEPCLLSSPKAARRESGPLRPKMQAELHLRDLSMNCSEFAGNSLAGKASRRVLNVEKPETSAAALDCKAASSR